jgi:hypothetical protein
MKIKEFIKITDEEENIRIEGQFIIKDDGFVQKKINEILKGGKK